MKGFLHKTVRYGATCEDIVVFCEKEGIDICVVNLHTIKPIDEETIINVARKTGAVVTAEEHQVFAGLGGAVAEVLSRNYPESLKK